MGLHPTGIGKKVKKVGESKRVKVGFEKKVKKGGKRAE